MIRVYYVVIFLLAFCLIPLQAQKNSSDRNSAIRLLRLRQIDADTKSFHRYAAAGDFEIVTLLLNAGVDPNAPGMDGSTALEVAAKKGHKEIVTLLLARGARADFLKTEYFKKSKINYIAKEWLSIVSQLTGPLLVLLGLIFTLIYRMKSIKQQEIEALQKFIPHLPSRDERAAALTVIAHLANPRIAFTLATMYPGIGAVNAILTLIDDDKLKSKSDETIRRLKVVVVESAKIGEEEAVEKILDYADSKNKGQELIRAKDSGGRTALMWAARKGHLSTLDLLLERDADPTIFDKKNKSAFHLAAAHDHIECLDSLLTRLEEYPQDKQKEVLNTKDRKQRTALDMARQEENSKAEKILENFLNKLNKQLNRRSPEPSK